MKIKIIFLTLMIFAITGCSAEYNLTISKDKFSETVKILEKESIVSENVEKQEFSNTVANSLANFEGIRSDLNRKKIIENDKVGYQYSYDYEVKSYSMTPSPVAECYESFEIKNNDNEIEIKTSEQFLCYNNYPMIDEFKVIINSNYKLIESNADFIENGKYTWNINYNEITNKPIYIKLEKEIDNSIKTKKSNIVFDFIKIIVLISILIGIIIFVKKKNKKDD